MELGAVADDASVDTRKLFAFWVRKPNDTASRPFHKLLWGTFKGRKCRVSWDFATEDDRYCAHFLNKSYMCEQEFQPNYYRKGQRAGRGREIMRARRGEKHMNYDESCSLIGGVVCASCLSRLTEIIHATTIKWEGEDDAHRGTKRNCRETVPPGREMASYHHSYQLEYDSTVRV
jgi:hypothetical protein